MKRRYLFLLLAVVAVALYLPGYSRWQYLRARNSQLERRIEVLSRENSRLAEEKRRLETDLSYIEKVARDNLGVAREGEIIYRVIPSDEGEDDKTP